MTLIAALCLIGSLLSARPRHARLRLHSARRDASRQVSLTGGRRTTRRAAVGIAAAGTVLLLALGQVVVVAAMVLAPVAIGARHLSSKRRTSTDLDVGLCLDLLGAAMSCGALPAPALSAVSRGVPGAAGEALSKAATSLSLGAEPGQAWAGVAAAVPQLSPAARTCARAAASGAGVAEELFRLAAAARADRQVARRRRLERAGVWLVLPLGLCFLPAFVLVAVVPVVLSAVPALTR